jgi:hypothetical protein
MERDLCVRLEDKMEVVVADEGGVKDMQKKAKQLKITSFFTKHSVFPSAMPAMLLNHPDNF